MALPKARTAGILKTTDEAVRCHFEGQTAGNRDGRTTRQVHLAGLFRWGIDTWLERLGWIRPCG